MSRREQRAVDPTSLAPLSTTSARPHKRASTKAKRVTALRDGLLGCRAPGGRFAFAVLLWPPSKSNKMRIYKVPTAFEHIERRILGKAQEVRDYEDVMKRAIAEALSALPYRIELYQPPKRKKLKPLNPLFGADTEVDVTIHLYEQRRTNADTDGVAKLVLDVITDMGVWWDDRQVGDVHILRASHVGERVDDELVVELSARAVASFASNPTHRPARRVSVSSAPASPRRSPRKRVCA